MVLILCLICTTSHPEVFLGKGVLKICSKCMGEQPCRSAISIKVQSDFTEIALRHGCSPVNFLRILRTPFPLTFAYLLRTELKKPPTFRIFDRILKVCYLRLGIAVGFFIFLRKSFFS